MSNDILSLTTPTRVDEQTFSWQVPSGWRQGRGAFGGLVAGAMVRAAEAFVGDATRSLRSMTVHLCGPVMQGEATLQLALLRQGSNTSTVMVSLVQGGEVQSHAVMLWAAARSGDVDNRPEAPAGDLRAWRELEPALVEPPMSPEFSPHFEYRVLEGFPFSEDEDARTAGWIRPKAPGAARDAAYLACVTDSWWPVGLTLLGEIRPVATVVYTFEILGGFEGLDPEAPLYYRARQVAGHEGYLVEFRELWGEDGRLLSMNQQTVALIR